MRILYLLALVILLAVPARPQTLTELGVIRGKLSTDTFINFYKRIYVSSHKVNFASAVKFCQDKGLKILTLESYGQYQDFKNVLKKNLDKIDEFTLIGCVSNQGHTYWRWYGTGADVSYNMDWAPGEPNTPNGEYCMSAKKYGTEIGMNDIWCNLNYRFFCSDVADTAFFFNALRTLKD